MVTKTRKVMNELHTHTHTHTQDSSINIKKENKGGKFCLFNIYKLILG